MQSAGLLQNKEILQGAGPSQSKELLQSAGLSQAKEILQGAGLSQNAEQGALCMMPRSGEFWRKEMPKKQKVKKEKKKKQYRNKTGEMLFDYVKTNRQYTEENRRRQEEEGVKTKGLKDLNTMEKTCIVIIVLGVIGLVVKYAIL
ncbi:MAG: hypothetical protein UIJ87_00765 [Anaerovoracaceae bacterium]|nr:hypothetical protein [Anaerovoracaceae bacterium]